MCFTLYITNAYNCLLYILHITRHLPYIRLYSYISLHIIVSHMSSSPEERASFSQTLASYTATPKTLCTSKLCCTHQVSL